MSNTLILQNEYKPGANTTKAAFSCNRNGAMLRWLLADRTSSRIGEPARAATFAATRLQHAAFDAFRSELEDVLAGAKVRSRLRTLHRYDQLDLSVYYVALGPEMASPTRPTGLARLWLASTEDAADCYGDVFLSAEDVARLVEWSKWSASRNFSPLGVASPVFGL